MLTVSFVVDDPQRPCGSDLGRDRLHILGSKSGPPLRAAFLSQ
jgi:hypothetical protein